MIQAGIETLKNLRQLDILPQSHRHFQRKRKGFLHIYFYIYIIGNLEWSVLEKSYCISQYVAAGKFPHKGAQPTEGAYVYCHPQTDCFVTSQLFRVAWPARYFKHIYIYISLHAGVWGRCVHIDWFNEECFAVKVSFNVYIYMSLSLSLSLSLSRTHSVFVMGIPT